MINSNYKYSDVTQKIIGCAMEVHRALGNGFQEVIYQRALAIEMGMQGLSFSREHEMDIFYKEQTINYLEAYKMEIGLLINFGNMSLQFKRVMKPQKSWQINHSLSFNQLNHSLCLSLIAFSWMMVSLSLGWFIAFLARIKASISSTRHVRLNNEISIQWLATSEKTPIPVTLPKISKAP